MMGLDAMHLLLAHLAAALAFFLWGIHGKNRIQIAAETVLVLAVPVFGLLSMLGYRAACRLLHMEKVHLQKETEEEDAFLVGGMKYDSNIVPFHDTFLMEDAGKKRELFTTAIKQEALTNQELLRMAMNDSDREIAYYAVSLLTTQMEKLENKLFVKEGQLQKEQEAEHLKDLEEYEEILREYLSHEKFIDHVTFRQKQGMYLGVLDRLVSEAVKIGQDFLSCPTM